MQAPDFTPWAPGLTPEDMAAALSAAGIIWAGRHYGYPFPDDQVELVKELARIFSSMPAGKGIVVWEEPTFLSDPTFIRQTNGRSLADAWKIAAGPVAFNFQLEMHMEQVAYLSWYTDQLVKPNLKIVSAYCYLKPDSPYLNWRWPLRIGFIQNTNGIKMAKEFEDWIDFAKWPKPIVQLVDPTAPKSAADFLVIPDFSEALHTLKNLPPMLANCIITLGINGANLESVHNDFKFIRQATQAKAFVLSEASPTNFKRWMDELMFNLAHNTPLDLVLANMNRPGEPKSYLFASRFFINTALPSSMANRLKEDLKREPEKLAHYQSKNDVSFTIGGSHVDHYQHAIKDLSDLNFKHEGGATTTISTLSKIAETMAKPPQKGEPRFLQHQLSDQSQSLARQIDRFVPGVNYLLRIRIGPHEIDWPSVDQPFPDDRLPQTDNGHILTVVFTEPNHFPEPKVGTIFYPAAGPSTTVEFPFIVSAEHTIFEGRIVILYENRVLQTALLRAPVSMDTTVNLDQKVTFSLEGIVRPPDLDLSGRKRFNAAFLFNHTANDEHKVTVMCNQQAHQLDLTDFKNAADAITSMFNAATWEKKNYGQLTSPETLNLLCRLAQNGHALYTAFDKAGALPQTLKNKDPIQVVMVHESDYFPIDFIYERSKPPKSTAQLCPHALDNLTKGLQCSDPCIQDESQVGYICPTAFWGLQRVIEWQRYPMQTGQAQDAGSGSSEPEPGENELHPLTKILFGSSTKIPQTKVKAFSDFIDQELKVPYIQALSWDDWTIEIHDQAPEMLVLMVHTSDEHGLPNMELAGNFLDPPNILEDQVDTHGNLHPTVLLLGCGTHLADVPAYNLAAQFRSNKAGVVVSTIAELLNEHAPLLAQAILSELAEKDPEKERTIGDVILKVKQKSLLNGLPIALALLAYGDADWKA